MARNPDRYLSRLLKNKVLRNHLRQVLLVLSFFVALIVFWQLKLTGITMADETFCGKEAHVHSEECPKVILRCELEECEAHIHTESCLHHKLICETEEAPAHTHDASCAAKTLICTLPEQGAHTHNDACLDKTLRCTIEETDGHTHDESCSEFQLTCTLPETKAGHIHGDSCYTLTPGCGLAESDTHTHSDACMVSTLICKAEEVLGHSHDSTCYIRVSTCEIPESEGHTHSHDCYLYGDDYVCGLTEFQGHFHNDDCYTYEEGVYGCGLEETPGHTHNDLCYEIGPGFVCGLTEAEGHVHTEECVGSDTRFSCGKAASKGHTHTEECYESVDTCPLEEHTHDVTCYSNDKADLETSDDWEMTLAGLTRSAITNENVVMVARSQLGYTESTRNYQVDAFGVRRGITRYGQWYGNPYGDWSTMFVSFCLYYAGSEAPANAGPESMRIEWEQLELYVTADAYAPQPGNVLFLNKPEPEPENEEGIPAFVSEDIPETTAIAEPYVSDDTPPPANAVAIITGFADGIISVIEGDLDNAVGETTYAVDDPAVLGYGIVPEDPAFAVLVEAPEGAQKIASAMGYNAQIFEEQGKSFLVYTESHGNYYAFDGEGKAVQVYPDENGDFYAQVSDAGSLLWTFAKQSAENTYMIQNTATGRYMHAFANNGAGVTTSSAYSSTLISSGSGVKIRSNSSDYAKLNPEDLVFQHTQSANDAAVYQFGVASLCTVWLDGTDGGLRYLTGSLDQKYSVPVGSTMKLPAQWQTPQKYAMRLKGWYDVVNNLYYPAGAEVEITGNTVFYADWISETYDIGQYNALVSDTVSTNSFITSYVFDYNYLFNVMSQNAAVTVNANEHNETWSQLALNNKVNYNSASSLDFIFVEYDGGGNLTMPNNRTDRNTYLGAGKITQGIYTAELGDILFNPYREVPGKHYLGTGDHLFQMDTDPNSEYYGYYYYDSQKNAASYNSSAGRFYVYDYLEATTDSLSNSGKYSDFLPLNSPYANLNDQDIQTYTYAGTDNQYNGVNHFRYDAAYSGGNCNAGNVITNYAFGMRMDMRFYLPNTPGETVSDGTYGNKDLYGNQMHFHFSGDDDVWVLVDGVMVLDLGGVHGVEGGDINFSTGQVTINGTVYTELSNNLKKVSSGEHTLTILYLERGSSQSNAAFYFNLAPRFTLTIQKEDVLTQELLDGAQFSVFKDAACSVPAELWVSEASYKANDPATNAFTVTNGVATMWGLAAGNTYYIRETRPPTAAGYSLPKGIIRLTIDKEGIHTYDVEVLPEADGSLTTGFTVHGIQIDKETQQAYIVATNVQDDISGEDVTVHVRKDWGDGESHDDTYVTVYLTITDPDGTVRRIREILLSHENDWMYSWTNLPKYDSQGNENRFGVEEAYLPGYTPNIEQVDAFTEIKWSEAYSFTNGETYLLQTTNGFLSTTGASDSTFCWVNADTAMDSPLANWTATVSGGKVKFTNGAGQIITYSSSGGRYYYPSTASSNSNQSMTAVDAGSSGFRFHIASGTRRYYIAALGTNGRFSTTTTANSGTIFTPIIATKDTTPLDENTTGYQITNVPLEEETSLTVTKVWDAPQAGAETDYLQAKVTVRLLANGVDTGRSVTLTLKNGWTESFLGLPYYDDDGTVITYTIEETWVTDRWTPLYGEIQVIQGSGNPTYSTTLTNIYRPLGGPELPATGTRARLMYILCGSGILLMSLVYGLSIRREQERRRRRSSRRRRQY